ncbi:MAG TPA: efflux RND transporter periplasmic adaptor subunit [Usitatibacteraceae bacterium]
MRRVSAIARTSNIGGLWGCACALFAMSQSPFVFANPFECLIEPNQIVEIRSSVEGVIEKVFVKRGDRVVTGQVLVQLESDAERSTAEMARYRAAMEGRIASAKNRLDYANKKLDRSEELNKQKFIAPQARDEAEAEKRIAEADLKDALENQELAKHDYRRNVDLLNRRTLRSPFNGVVMDRMLNPGDLAEAGTGRKAMLRLAQVEPLRVEVVLPLDAHNKVKIGSAATVFPEGLGGSYPATVRVVDSVFDSASGTFGVRLELPNPKGVLPAGIGCRVEFPTMKGVVQHPVKTK